MLSLDVRYSVLESSPICSCQVKGFSGPAHTRGLRAEVAEVTSPWLYQDVNKLRCWDFVVKGWSMYLELTDLGRMMGHVDLSRLADATETPQAEC